LRHSQLEMYKSMKKKFKRQIFLLLTIFALVIIPASCSKKTEVTHWIGAWNGSATDFTFFKLNYKNQTLKSIVTATFGGSKERVKISNEFGTEALTIGAASFAVVNSEGVIYNDSKRTLTFGGKPNITIEKGAFVWSDSFEVDIKALDKVAVSIYLPSEVKNVTGTCGGVESYFSGSGNFIDSVYPEKDFKPIGVNGIPKVSPFFTSIEVMTSEKNGSIIAFGDSITTFSWPDHFARRLRDADIKNLLVIIEAIGGNRILHNSESNLHGLFGPSGVSRFEKAITEHQGARYVIVLEGVNDIMHTGPGGPAPATEIVSKNEIIEGLQKYIELAH